MYHLTERHNVVLDNVVRGYVATATPISSKSLVGQPGLGVSSATIRGEMALLEQEGYLTHPHTSAGRVPTEKGYRYFVEYLMEDRELPLEEQRMIRHQFHQARMDLEQWMRLAAAILAHSVHSASLVTAPKATRTKFKHLELLSLGEKTALLILVLQDGTIQQERLSLPDPVDQEELSRAANEMVSRFGGLTRGEIISRLGGLPETLADVGQRVAQMMEELDRRGSSELYHDGLVHILRQPEFSEAARVERIMGLLATSGFFEALLEEARLSLGGVQIVIGGEAGYREMNDCSLVLTRYGAREEATGVLGVLGPVRLPYQRCVSAVRYLSSLMTDFFEPLP